MTGSWPRTTDSKATSCNRGTSVRQGVIEWQGVIWQGVIWQGVIERKGVIW